MEQTNAFELLGATPSNSIETLQELLDEKELLSDDIAAVQSAYADLTNPKKRLIHEITYFYKDDLSDFLQLITKGLEEKPTIAKTATILVNIGKWFEEKIRVKSTEFDDEFDLASLFDDSNEEETPKIENDALVKINNARLSIHMSIVDETTLMDTLYVLRTEYVALANSFLDKLQKYIVVKIFNSIVKKYDYESFFIDELVAHYELIISESLQKKEKECRTSFENIEKSCNSFNNGTPLSPSLKTQISVFADKLNSWDNYAQPLQVNMQRHGGQHESSERLVCDIRNKMIELCNRSQDSLSKMIDNLTNANDSGLGHLYVQNLRELLPQKLSDSLIFLDALIQLTDILISVFAEVEFTAEQLKKDKTDLLDLRKTISSLNDKVNIIKNTQIQSMQVFQPSYRTRSGGCYIATCVYGSYDCPEVWTLRRYRDKTLGSSWYGRLFIKLYYAISPTVVKLFGKTKWFQSLWKKVLDKKIQRLHKKGFEDTPYADIDWRQK